MGGVNDEESSAHNNNDTCVVCCVSVECANLGYLVHAEWEMEGSGMARLTYFRSFYKRWNVIVATLIANNI